MKISGRGEAARGAVWRVYEGAKTREVRLEEARSCRQSAIRSTAVLAVLKKEAPDGKRGSRRCWIWAEASARRWRGGDGTTGWELRAEGRGRKRMDP